MEKLKAEIMELVKGMHNMFVLEQVKILLQKVR
jgi:hypothetical protein